MVFAEIKSAIPSFYGDIHQLAQAPMTGLLFVFFWITTGDFENFNDLRIGIGRRLLWTGIV